MKTNLLSFCKVFFSVLLMFLSVFGWGQTNPAAFDLSAANFSFLTQTATSTAYPASMQGWATSANNITSAETNAPSADQALVASGTATTSGISNLGVSGFNFLSTGSAPNRVVGSISLGLNTTNRKSITVGWLAAD